MKVAVTGASGFLGTTLVQDLVNQGFAVVCLSRRLPLDQPDVLPSSQWQQIDYSDPDQIYRALVGCDALVHLAGIAHSKAASNDTSLYEQAIFEATKFMLEAAQAAEVKTFIYASSVKVYGEKSLGPALSESSNPQPNSIYGTCKLKAERLIEQKGECLATAIFRFPPMYGPDMKGSIKHIFKAAKLGLPLPFHSFKHRRHFLYVKNASSLIISTIRGDLKPGLYNVFDPIAWQMGPFYREVYRAVHGRELPWYLTWRIPAFLEKLIRKIPALAPLMQPFELESRDFQHWSRFLTHTPEQGIREVACSGMFRTQDN